MASKSPVVFLCKSESSAEVYYNALITAIHEKRPDIRVFAELNVPSSVQLDNLSVADVCLFMVNSGNYKFTPQQYNLYEHAQKYGKTTYVTMVHGGKIRFYTILAAYGYTVDYRVIIGEELSTTKVLPKETVQEQHLVNFMCTNLNGGDDYQKVIYKASQKLSADITPNFKQVCSTQDIDKMSAVVVVTPASGSGRHWITEAMYRYLMSCLEAEKLVVISYVTHEGKHNFYLLNDVEFAGNGIATGMKYGKMIFGEWATHKLKQVLFSPIVTQGSDYDVDKLKEYPMTFSEAFKACGTGTLPQNLILVRRRRML